MSWDVWVSTHASAKRINNSTQSCNDDQARSDWTLPVVRSCHRISVENTREYCDTLFTLLMVEPIMMHGNALMSFRRLGWCDDRGSVLASTAAAIADHPRALWTPSNKCHNCTYETTAAELMLYHTRTGTSPSEEPRSTSWQLIGCTSLLADRPLHTL